MGSLFNRIRDGVLALATFSSPLSFLATVCREPSGASVVQAITTLEEVFSNRSCKYEPISDREALVCGGPSRPLHETVAARFSKSEE